MWIRNNPAAHESVAYLLERATAAVGRSCTHGRATLITHAYAADLDDFTLVRSDTGSRSSLHCPWTHARNNSLISNA